MSVLNKTESEVKAFREQHRNYYTGDKEIYTDGEREEIEKGALANKERKIRNLLAEGLELCALMKTKFDVSEIKESLTVLNKFIQDENVKPDIAEQISRYLVEMVSNLQVLHYAT